MRYSDPCILEQEPNHYHKSQHQHHVHPLPERLYVVTMVSNPNRFYSRYKLYERFEKMVADAGAILYTVEVAFRDRHFEITDCDNPRHIQLRSPSQLWHKENALNIAISRLPADWKYVAWIDADVEFARPDWVVETIHKLQHYKVIQMFSHALDLGPKFQPLGHFRSFMYSYMMGEQMPVRQSSSGDKTYSPANNLWHPGYAWAARRSAVSDLGGLGDCAILGAGDHHMARALIGDVESSFLGNKVHANYAKYWLNWQDRAERYINREVGAMDGLLLHQWHGKKKDRQYINRWQILTGNRPYDPEIDVKYDVQGLLQLTENNRDLRDGVKRYFAQREEDSIDLD